MQHNIFAIFSAWCVRDDIYFIIKYRKALSMH